jgi:AraC-like DNA-binding protein
MVQLEDARSRLPVSNQITFLNLVAETLDDEMLGLNLALELDLRRAGLFYYVLASSATLMEVFERGARFTAIVNEGVVQQCVRGRRIGLALNYAGVRRRDDQHQIEFWVAVLLRIGRQVSGRHLKPALVRLTHRRPNGHAQLARFLGCEVEFGAMQDQILFARDLGATKIVNADPYLNRLLVDMCDEVLSRHRRALGTFAARVENAVVPLLPHGEARAARIAGEFGMSERTFARRLAEEGLTFPLLIERLRLDLARRYLRDDELSVSKAAWLLGYKEVGAFSHAFRRWTGQSPSAFAAHAA